MRNNSKLNGSVTAEKCETMAIPYRIPDGGTRIVFWRRAHVCWFWLCVILGSAKTQFTQRSVANDSSTQFSNFQDSFLNETDDEVKRPKLTDFLNSDLFRNLSLYANETKIHIDALNRDFERVQSDIKNVEQILTNVDSEVKHIEHSQDSREIDLRNRETRDARRRAAFNRAEPRQSSTKSIAQDENVESIAESSENSSKNPISIEVGGGTIRYSENTPDPSIPNISSTFEDSTKASQFDPTILVQPKSSSTGAANGTEDVSPADPTDLDVAVTMLAQTTSLPPAEDVSSSDSRSSNQFDGDVIEKEMFGTTVSLADDETKKPSNVDEMTNVSEDAQDSSFIASTPSYSLANSPVENTNTGAPTYHKETSTSKGTEDLPTTHEPYSSSAKFSTPLSSVSSDVTTVPNIVSTTQGSESIPHNELQNFQPEDILRYLAAKIANNTAGNSVNGSLYVQKRICFQNIDTMRVQTSGPADMYIYYEWFEPEEEEETAEPSSNDMYPHPKDDLSADGSDQYGAYSLHNHKLVSKYSFANEVNKRNRDQTSSTFSNDTESRPSEAVFCIKVPVRVAPGQKKSSSENEDNDVFPQNARKRKHHYTQPTFFNELYTIPDQACKMRCMDNGACVTEAEICNNIMNCRDMSDELNCSCRDRMDVEKICDGYHDCPDGSDEEGCQNCPKGFFNCKESGSKHMKPHYIPMTKRCDNIPDCDSGSDEHNCEVLAETIDSHEDPTSGYTSGYLHRNWQGKWYPVCEEEPNYDWAVKACAAEVGSRKTHVEMEILPFVNEYNGHFVSKTRYEGRFVLMENCGVRNRAVHVKCPPIACGSRMSTLEYFESAYRSRRHVEEDSLEVAHTLEDIYHDINYIRVHLWHNDSENGFRNIQEGLHYLEERHQNISQKPRNVHLIGSRGVQGRSAEGRVVAGKPSVPGKWPWVVAIFQNGNFHCGGTILDESWIMTAAHCFHRYEQYYYEVRAGVLRRLSFSPSEQIRSVSQIIMHPNFMNVDMQNDLALLRLESPLNYNRWVRPICLPEPRPPWGPLPGTYCTAIGWGSTKEKGSNPDNLREVDLPILPNCKLTSDKEADEICAGVSKGGRDTCQGDSGGPLLCQIPGTRDRWYVAGVVSHGEGCGRPMEPGAYTRVALYIPWLMQNTDSTILRGSRNPRKDCPGVRCEVGGRCIPLSKRCDRVIDCLDAEDEKDCLPFESYEEYECDKEYMYQTLSLRGFRQMEKCKKTGHSISGNNSSLYRSSNESMEYLPPISYNKTTHFLCKKVVQVIPRDWHCDGDVDCEDGTDEANCTCVDFLRAENKSLICDGVIHCHDASDEKHCIDEPCSKTQFYCYNSRVCINDRVSICNGTAECPRGEDEENCYAIFPFSEDGSRMKLNYFEQPAFAERGIITKNEKGVWTPVCVPSENQNEINNLNVIRKHLRKLGFKDTTNNFKDMMVINGDLQHPSFDLTYCRGVFVDLRHGIHKTDYAFLPWHADIFVNGKRRCSGLLVPDQWIIAGFACCLEFNATEDTVVAVMGGNAESKVRSPHHQTILADEAKCHVDSGIMVIHLSQSPNVTSHSRALRVPHLLHLQPDIKDMCYLIFNYEGSEDSVRAQLQMEDCPSKKRCFSIRKKEELCKKSTNGTLLLEGVVCNQRSQWYLATTVKGRDEYFCSSETNVLEFGYLDNRSSVFTRPNGTRSKSSPSSPSHHFLCDLGKRIDWSEVCDGKPDCQYGEDEDEIRCSMKESTCKNDTRNGCGCKVGEFRCRNGNCISNAFICDGEQDCADGSDEPEQCSRGEFTCAVYLNLTNPSKLCDMRQDCFDRSDEDNDTCSHECDPLLSFNCSESNKCIPMDFVCDGVQDCHAGEDEKDCQEWRPVTPDNRGNVTGPWKRFRGKWQELCEHTDEYTGLNEDALCQRLGFSTLLKSREITSSKLITEDIFTVVRLGNGQEIRIKNHRPKKVNPDLKEECTSWNLLCGE